MYLMFIIYKHIDKLHVMGFFITYNGCNNLVSVNEKESWMMLIGLWGAGEHLHK